MEIDGNLINLPNLIECGNHIRDLVLKQMQKDGVLTPEQVEEYSTSWQIIIFKQSWFSRWFKKFRPNQNSSGGEYIYKFVKFED